jgi:hypothetical protein
VSIGYRARAAGALPPLTAADGLVQALLDAARERNSAVLSAPSLSDALAADRIGIVSPGRATVGSQAWQPLDRGRNTCMLAPEGRRQAARDGSHASLIEVWYTLGGGIRGVQVPYDF